MKYCVVTLRNFESTIPAYQTARRLKMKRFSPSAWNVYALKITLQQIVPTIASTNLRTNTDPLNRPSLRLVRATL
jgi:hypothetical protein